ncbi:MAG: (deoxy)nucleoside triphosphate pyrophosphohydrolase [Bacteroidota bacterium]|nr:(deoxy)nucleoside triphosphate pyrophosphohydrolase [Bacteroidota bacterium]
MIEVVCAIIVLNHEILAVQRSKLMDNAGKWEFPGGKVDVGETLGDAVVREIREELSIEIQPNLQLEPVVYDYGDRCIRLWPFICNGFSGSISLNEHDTLQFVTMENIDRLLWADADSEIVRNLKHLSLI